MKFKNVSLDKNINYIAIISLIATMEYSGNVSFLLKNSRAAMMSAIEIHNKPSFAYRYEIVTILVVNAWELALKAFIILNYPEITVIYNDGTTKSFEECLNCVSGKLGNSFLTSKSNLESVYRYRCDFIHFYDQNIDQIIFSLLSKNVQLYYQFLKGKLDVDLAEEANLILLPIGFKRIISPILFLSSKSSLDNSSQELISFINSIVNTTYFLQSKGIEDSILLHFKMNLTNEDRIKNADIIAAITKRKSEASATVALNLPQDITITDSVEAKRIRIDEETIFESIYTEYFRKVVRNARNMFTDFKQNKLFSFIMSNIKNNPTFHKKRLLDPKAVNGLSKDYYTKAIYEELKKHYQVSE